MPRVHLLTPTLTPGDAVSNDVFGMRAWFRRRNLRADVYAETLHHRVRGEALPVSAYKAHLGARDDLLIYHHSTLWERGLELFGRSRNRKVLRYHSVTPARFFQPYEYDYALTCLKGAAQTAALLRHGPEAAWANSAASARELEAGGFRKGVVVPPLHPVAALKRAGTDEELAARLRERPTFLFVGRVVPNKGHLHLIRALGYYHRHLSRDARLVVVGALDLFLKHYHDALERAIAAHDLHGSVTFTGPVSDRQLATYYRHASAFWCASEHEGFCVPLVEAMCFDLPVVAYAHGAVADTFGGTGIAWDTPDPALLAESAYRVTTRPDVREAVVRGQRRRYEHHYTPDALQRRFEAAVEPLLQPHLSCV